MKSFYGLLGPVLGAIPYSFNKPKLPADKFVGTPLIP